MQSLNIAILGYGKMGKEIEKTAIERGHKIVCIIDNEDDWQNKIEDFQKSDIVIDFSEPYAVVENIKKCFKYNMAVVVGTTAWQDERENLKQLCLDQDQSLLYASNFSIGVNIFFELVDFLSKQMNSHKLYSCNMSEIHHTQKLDKPSGTAVSIANILIENLEQYKSYALQEDLKDEDNSILAIECNREENIVGAHEVGFESEVDSISIKHSAKSRKGFALGAVQGAEWLFGRKGFFSMKDMLKF